jgi:dihydroorotate dehydrogenase
MSGIVQSAGVAALKLLPPEMAHDATIKALKAGLGPKAQPDDPRLAITLAGLKLPNPIGLAAGFDKNAQVPDAMLAAGFGFVECGTVTPLPQAGNPKPRVFRLPNDEGVINRLGFNNGGLAAYVNRLRARASKPGVVGANIGANKDSADRIGDYVTGLRRVWLNCSYVTVNISSPNTPGLRGLQTRAALEELLGALAKAREVQAQAHGQKPLFLKVAPDLDASEIEAIVEVTLAHQIDALIVSNTTIDRPESLVSAARTEQGGLSGRPLFAKSTKVLGEVAAAMAGRMPLIGVGGIMSAADAIAKLDAGATAIQLYSGLTIRGLGLLDEIKQGLLDRIDARAATEL